MTPSATLTPAPGDAGPSVPGPWVPGDPAPFDG